MIMSFNSSKVGHACVAESERICLAYSPSVTSPLLTRRSPNNGSFDLLPPSQDVCFPHHSFKPSTGSPGGGPTVALPVIFPTFLGKFHRKGLYVFKCFSGFWDLLPEYQCGLSFPRFPPFPHGKGYVTDTSLPYV